MSKARVTLYNEQKYHSPKIPFLQGFVLSYVTNIKYELEIFFGESTTHTHNQIMSLGDEGSNQYRTITMSTLAAYATMTYQSLKIDNHHLLHSPATEEMYLVS
jgi:hypothetical protein